MNIFVPMTQPPQSDYPYWINRTYGGLNECIVIDGKTGSVVPNCTGFAWGRMYMLTGEKPKLPTTDAKYWFTTYLGYSRGQVPALGAVACWAGTQHGHVAIVESIGPDYIMCSQSNYGGARFEYVKCLKMLNGGYITPGGNTAFQGFIYCPVKWHAQGSDDIPENNPYKSVNDIALAIIKGTGIWYRCNGSKRREKIKSFGFDPEEVQQRVNKIMLTEYNTIDDIALAIIRGNDEWYKCYGDERRRLCEAYGFNYKEVQKRIDEMMEEMK